MSLDLTARWNFFFDVLDPAGTNPNVPFDCSNLLVRLGETRHFPADKLAALRPVLNTLLVTVLNGFGFLGNIAGAVIGAVIAFEIAKWKFILGIVGAVVGLIIPAAWWAPAVAPLFALADINGVGFLTEIEVVTAVTFANPEITVDKITAAFRALVPGGKFTVEIFTTTLWAYFTAPICDPNIILLYSVFRPKPTAPRGGINIGVGPINVGIGL